MARLPHALLVTCALLAACAPSGAGSAASGGTISADHRPPSPSAPGPVSSLTGLPLRDAGQGRRPIVAVKIDNVAAAKPPAGLAEAELVVEEPVEGGLTRLMAVFQRHDVPRVGPVRSARVTDASLLRALGGGALACSGASGATTRVLRREPGVLLVTPSAGTGWRRDSRRQGPHDLFVDLGRLRRRLRPVGRVHQVPVFTFGDARPASARPVTGVRVRWTATRVAWSWDAGARRWERTQGGRRDLAESGRRLTATNVVVLGVRTTTSRRFRDVNGALTPLPDLRSGGTAWVLRNGTVTVGRWSRGRENQPFTLRDDRGGALSLDPGRTWVEILPRPSRPSFSSGS